MRGLYKGKGMQPFGTLGRPKAERAPTESGASQQQQQYTHNKQVSRRSNKTLGITARNVPCYEGCHHDTPPFFLNTVTARMPCQAPNALLLSNAMTPGNLDQALIQPKQAIQCTRPVTLLDVFFVLHSTTSDEKFYMHFLSPTRIGLVSKTSLHSVSISCEENRIPSSSTLLQDSTRKYHPEHPCEKSVLFWSQRNSATA